MITHAWSVVCTKSTIDSETNNISLHDVLESVHLELPKGQEHDSARLQADIPMPHEIVSLFARTTDVQKEEALAVQVNLLGPDGKQIGSSEQHLVIPAGMRRYRTRNRVAGFPIRGVGEYVFEVGIKQADEEGFQVVALIPFEVTAHTA